MKPSQPSHVAYAAASWLLMCEEPVLRAIAEVEAGQWGAFMATGEPVILFERHIFHRLTGGKFDEHSDISNPVPGGYGAYSEQHHRLQRAAELDRFAALQSASWGLFQIMGFNHKDAGFPELQEFVNAAYRSADDHLRMLVMFVRNTPGLALALQKKDWQSFAFRYNGPRYADSAYDRRMAKAYAKWSSGGAG